MPAMLQGPRHPRSGPTFVPLRLVFSALRVLACFCFCVLCSFAFLLEGMNELAATPSLGGSLSACGKLEAQALLSTKQERL